MVSEDIVSRLFGVRMIRIVVSSKIEAWHSALSEFLLNPEP